MLTSLFVTHAQNELHIEQPIIVNLCLFLVIALLILITCRQTEEDKPLSVIQTNQMKGLAVILVILHHLATYVIAKPEELSIFQNNGYVGVAIFLIISGFGLSISLQKKGIKNFFTKRVIRIFIPLVFYKLFSIFVEYFVIRGNHDYIKIPLDFFKLYSSEWFIPFILFWYCLTYLVFRINLSNRGKVLFYFSVSLILIIIPQVPGLWKVHAFSYPLGCWLGFNSRFIREKINTLLNSNIAILLGIILGGFGLSTLPKIQYLLITVAAIIYLVFIPKKNIEFKSFLENACLGLTLTIICFNYLEWVSDYRTAATGVLKIVGEFSYSFLGIFLAVILCLCISLLVKFKKYSVLLNFLGEISFELYLIHGIFMYSIDFVLFRGSLAITFFLYFIIICLASILLQKLSSITSDLLYKKLSV